MNYQKIYNNIVQKASFENRVRRDYSDVKYIYYEQHHIIPRCLKGDDSKENLVLLTAKEHFIVHKLLVEIHPNNHKLINAFWMMSNKVSSNGNRVYRVGVREYSRLKSLFCRRISGKNSPMYGKAPWNKDRVVPEEEKQHLRELNIGKKRSRESVLKQMETNKVKYPDKENFKSNLGKKQSRETVEKRIKSNTGKKRTKDFCSNLSNSRVGEGNPMYGQKAWNKNIPWSEEHKDKLKESWQNREKVECPHCGKIGHQNGMTHYHFDNCKHNSSRNIVRIRS